MLLVLALVLALLFLPWPWNFAVVMVAAACEAAVAVAGVRYTRRRRARVGVETLVGRTASVVTALAPEGQVKVDGEIWQARSQHAVSVGDPVVIRRVDGLTLEVEPRPHVEGR